MRSLAGKVLVALFSSVVVAACANAGEVTFDEDGLNPQTGDASTKGDVVTTRDSGNNNKADSGNTTPDTGTGQPDTGTGLPDTGTGLPDTGTGGGAVCDPNDQSYAAKYILELLNPNPIVCAGGAACPNTHCCYGGILCLPL